MLWPYCDAINPCTRRIAARSCVTLLANVCFNSAGNATIAKCDAARVTAEYIKLVVMNFEIIGKTTNTLSNVNPWIL